MTVKITDEMRDESGEIDLDLVMDEAYDKLPSGLCWHCSTGNTGAGFRERSEVYLALADQPEIHYITDADDKVVWGDPNEKLGW